MNNFERAKRDQDIYFWRVKQNMTLSALAQNYGLSKERVRQIVEREKAFAKTQKPPVKTLRDLPLPPRLKGCLTRTTFSFNRLIDCPIDLFLQVWNYDKLKSIPAMGATSIAQLTTLLEEQGHDVSNIRPPRDR